MDAIEAIKARRSVRNFEEKPVPPEVIEDIVDCGRLAPTAINIQPWEFVVVTNAEMRVKIADMTDYGKFIKDAPLCIVVFCRDTKYYLEDGCAAVENILLAAAAHGLGSCWVAGDKKSYANGIKDLLGARAEYKLIALLPIGYPVGGSRANKRTLSEVIHWEKF